MPAPLVSCGVCNDACEVVTTVISVSGVTQHRLHNRQMAPLVRDRLVTSQSFKGGHINNTEIIS